MYGNIRFAFHHIKAHIQCEAKHQHHWNSQIKELVIVSRYGSLPSATSAHSKRTNLVTRLVTRVGSCNGLQGSYKLVMMAFQACNPMELVMMTRLVMIFK